jgi:RHS repeat-associated protein
MSITSTFEYYLFGMLQPGRSFTSSSNYRFGFNGKENDNEVYGEGNFQDYGMRMYDTRLGRFISVDPLTRKYPELTPYQFASNGPISGIDLDGLETADPKQKDNNAHVSVFKAFEVSQTMGLKTALITFGQFTQFLDDLNSSNLKRTPDQKAAYEASAKSNAENLFAGILLGYGVGKLIGVASSLNTEMSTVSTEPGGFFGDYETTNTSTTNTPNFVVDPKGTVAPIPDGANGPVPVINENGNQTGLAYTGGKGGKNGNVTSVRVMNPNKLNPNGYVKYYNDAQPRQGLDPYSGRTLPNSKNHFEFNTVPITDFPEK